MPHTTKTNAVALLYPEGANIKIPFYVEFHSGYKEDDITDIVRKMFPHMGDSVYGEMEQEETT